jgi:hypothetical protein
LHSKFIVADYRKTFLPLKCTLSLRKRRLTQYRIKDFKTRDAYEGHYLHYNVRVDTFSTMGKFAAGDMVIPVPEFCNRYDICMARFIIETLEPTAPDSYSRGTFSMAYSCKKSISVIMYLKIWQRSCCALTRWCVKSCAKKWPPNPSGPKTATRCCVGCTSGRCFMSLRIGCIRWLG